MNKLVSTALLTAAMIYSTGCIITSDDDDPIILDGQFDVSWSLTEGADDGTASPCPAGGSAEVHSVPDVGEEFVDIFDCVDGIGATALLPAGNYLVYVNILDVDGNLWAQSFSVDSAVADGAITELDFIFPADGGFFALTWTMSEEGSGNPLSCADVGGDGVSVLSTLVGPNTATDDIFDCSAGEVSHLTDPAFPKMILGDYSVVVALLDADEAVLGQAEPKDALVEWGNQVVDLGNFDFTFPPL